MEIDVEKLDEDAVFKLSGRLDMNSSPDLRKPRSRFTQGHMQESHDRFRQRFLHRHLWASHSH
jgi:hypothetical protein